MIFQDLHTCVRWHTKHSRIFRRCRTTYDLPLKEMPCDLGHIIMGYKSPTHMLQ